MTQSVYVPPSWLYETIRLTMKAIAWPIAHQDVSGLENVPASGAFIIVVNHLSIFEPPVIFMQFPGQFVVMMADKYRTMPGVAQLGQVIGTIWVNREMADPDAIKAAIGLLKSGRGIGLAPEGTRSKTGGLEKGKVGAAYLADRTGVPILPVAVFGGETIAGNLKRLRRSRIQCVVGKSFHLPQNGRAKGAVLDEYTDIIMCHIAALLPTQYRGVYTEHPKLRELLGQPAF